MLHFLFFSSSGRLPLSLSFCSCLSLFLHSEPSRYPLRDALKTRARKSSSFPSLLFAFRSKKSSIENGLRRQRHGLLLWSGCVFFDPSFFLYLPRELHARHALLSAVVGRRRQRLKRLVHLLLLFHLNHRCLSNRHRFSHPKTSTSTFKQKNLQPPPLPPSAPRPERRPRPRPPPPLEPPQQQERLSPPLEVLVSL